ncbi:MAG: CAP domain-containing protein [Candidatus Paceibacterota bacterium]|nr:CAP domain-containing protein [Candidatus Paceibacterota bacterium]
MNKLKKYFIPHRGNEYKPHFFRLPAVLATASLIGLLFLFAASLSTIIIKGSSQLGAVISSVLVDLANTDRTANNLGGLSSNPVLEKVAQMKADDMAAKEYFAHTSPEGKSPWYWFRQAGYQYSFAGENLAVYFSDSTEVEKAWMNSPTHRANILNSKFTEVGIAMARGKYRGVDTVYVVQVFGRPSTRSVATVAAANIPVQNETKPLPEVKKPAEKPAVKGAATETSPKVLLEEETFIAVENMDSVPAIAEEAAPRENSASAILKVVASPKTFLKTAYGAFAVVIAFALFLMIGVELKRQHFRHIAYGVSLMLLMGAFLFAWQFFFFGKLLVV